MKIICINGSPRGKNSNSHRIASEFLEGAQKAGAEVETVEVALDAADQNPDDSSYAGNYMQGVQPCHPKVDAKENADALLHQIHFFRS